MYSMKRQLGIGEKGERQLDKHFSKWYHIRDATRQQQRQGIDRIFTGKKDGRTYTIEYKCDKTAARTGNAFVETVSVDSQGKPGWAYTCQSDFIIYHIVDRGPTYIIKPGDIKKRLNTWSRKYPERAIPNRGYRTIGLLVPLAEFERIAHDVLNL